MNDLDKRIDEIRELFPRNVESWGRSDAEKWYRTQIKALIDEEKIAERERMKNIAQKFHRTFEPGTHPTQKKILELAKTDDVFHMNYGEMGRRIGVDHREKVKHHFLMLCRYRLLIPE